MRSFRWLWTVIILGMLGVVVSAQESETRSFDMGFTPFPYEVSMDAVIYTYQTIAQDADLIVHHFDNGVPWEEALNGVPYSQHLMQDWSLRLGSTPQNHKRMVTVSPINLDRTGIASYHGETDNMPLPAPWNTRSFDDPAVIQAFMQYCDTIIAYFNPDYFLMGIEVNLLMRNNPALWEAYMTLHRTVYADLKAKYPDLTVLVSLTGIDILEGYTDADHAQQLQALADIVDYTDIVGWSLYPYMTHYMTNSIPMDMFEKLEALTDKPMAITETGYPAQSFGIMAGNIRIVLDGTPEKQADYLALVLEKAQEYDYAFVVNFILRDYDALWQMIGGHEDFTIAWRDTGFYDENGGERPVLDIWRAWLAKPRS